MKNLKSFAKSTFWTLFYQGVSLLFNFLLNVVLARTLGPAGKGLFSVYILTPSLLSMLLSLSIDESNVYYAGKGYRVKDIFLISIFHTVIVSFILILSFLLFPHLYSSLFKNLDHSVLFYAVLITPLFLLFRYIRSIFLGIGHVKMYNFLDSMRVGILFLGVTLLLLSNPDIRSAEKAVNLHIVIAVLISFVLLFNQLHLGKTESNIINLFKKELRYGLRAYLGITMSFFNRRLDVFILNYFRNPQEVGIYSISTALAELIWKLPNSVAIPLFPKVAKEDKRETTPFTTFITRVIFFLLIILGVFMVLAGKFVIVLLFGHRFSASYTPLLWLLPGIVFLGVGRVLSAYFHGINKPEYGSFFTIISVIFTIVFDLILIPTMGAIGAAIASSIAYTIAGILAIFLYCKETGTSPLLLFTPPIKEISRILQMKKGR